MAMEFSAPAAVPRSAVFKLQRRVSIDGVAAHVRASRRAAALFSWLQTDSRLCCGFGNPTSAISDTFVGCRGIRLSYGDAQVVLR